jgi:hypothetical protein
MSGSTGIMAFPVRRSHSQSNPSRAIYTQAIFKSKPIHRILRLVRGPQRANTGVRPDRPAGRIDEHGGLSYKPAEFKRRRAQFAFGSMPGRGRRATIHRRHADDQRRRAP